MHYLQGITQIHFWTLTFYLFNFLIVVIGIAISIQQDRLYLFFLCRWIQIFKTMFFYVFNDVITKKKAILFIIFLIRTGKPQGCEQILAEM